MDGSNPRRFLGSLKKIICCWIAIKQKPWINTENRVIGKFRRISNQKTTSVIPRETLIKVGKKWDLRRRERPEGIGHRRRHRSHRRHFRRSLDRHRRRKPCRGRRRSPAARSIESEDEERDRVPVFGVERITRRRQSEKKRRRDPKATMGGDSKHNPS